MNNYVVYLKLKYCLFVNYTLIKKPFKEYIGKKFFNQIRGDKIEQ